jgi:osmoprotectant transport system permease protein
VVKRRGTSLAALSLAAAAAVACLHERERPVLVGSKKFTESYVLGEIAVRALRESGQPAEHRPGMGGTIILWEALKGGAIGAYPEYTGTIREEILPGRPADTFGEMAAALAREGVGVTAPLGFNNTYALVMRRGRARDLGITRISDLANHPRLTFGLTHEFLKRRDGWEPLAARYGLRGAEVRGVDHALGYAALVSSSVDVKDAYSTDARIAEDDLLVLQDDLGFFPRYEAVFLYRLGLPRRAVGAIAHLSGTISEERMIRLNAEAERTKDYARAANLYFGSAVASESVAHKIARWTLRHLELVGVSLFFAILLGVPLGIAASRPGPVSRAILGATGVIQTIPALALLALLVPVPFLGIQAITAVVALFLYSLLPIVRNTAAGLEGISGSVKESAEALGLPPSARLFRVYLPMASRTILAGIKTSAVINIGGATLAALIGAGGLGEPIVSGLNLNDNKTILEGALPAAGLALLAELFFDLLDRLVIPKGLRLPPAG